MPSEGFEPEIPVGDRPQTHALDRSATGIGKSYWIRHKNGGTKKKFTSRVIHWVTEKNYRATFADED
jgi:hypothetical protein